MPRRISLANANASHYLEDQISLWVGAYAMYVCVCNAINCRTVRTHIGAGAQSVGAVFKAQGCSPRCGRCFDTMREMIDEGKGANTSEPVLRAAE
ncbi:(2Fe-2S)-binding protein [Nitrospirillum iridis]|uniref:Bacterioferritin-associated ferredoxin n=1 Tax=Nitrospirillum iridis TaxID=765888 RepID=A0A7X0AXZ6_9PROT|nr:(2Fe-2S)-binding protein [Nitrospirillum iridis]MBB6250674.1 bacterioferritin-associated ferredoxin [Nitrospirillum iridis]